jgi:Lon protease-like protein
MSQPSDTELDAARRELQDLYRRLSVARPFSWSRMGNQVQIARLKRRIATLERRG